MRSKVSGTAADAQRTRIQRASKSSQSTAATSTRISPTCSYILHCTDLHTRWRGTTAACLLLTLQLLNRAFLRVDRSCVVFVLCTEMAYSVLSSRILVPLLVISMQLNHHFVNSQCKKLLPYYLHYISAKLQIIIMLCLYYDTYQRSTIRK